LGNRQVTGGQFHFFPINPNKLKGKSEPKKEIIYARVISGLLPGLPLFFWLLVGLGVLVGFGVFVGLSTLVDVGVWVGFGVRVRVGVREGLLVRVLVGVREGVGVMVMVPVDVGDWQKVVALTVPWLPPPETARSNVPKSPDVLTLVDAPAFN
jgi:hypothetical protein